MATKQTSRPVWTFTDRLVKARKTAEFSGEELAARLAIHHRDLHRMVPRPRREGR